MSDLRPWLGMADPRQLIMPDVARLAVTHVTKESAVHFLKEGPHAQRASGGMLMRTRILCAMRQAWAWVGVAVYGALCALNCMWFGKIVGMVARKASASKRHVI